MPATGVSVSEPVSAVPLGFSPSASVTGVEAVGKRLPFSSSTETVIAGVSNADVSAGCGWVSKTRLVATGATAKVSEATALSDERPVTATALMVVVLVREIGAV